MHPLLKRTLLALAAALITTIVYVLLSEADTIERATDLIPAVVVGAIVFLMASPKRKGNPSS
ncbi:MAG: hypothetical protein RhofKO_37250 [Rhodothermales bacterium]